MYTPCIHTHTPIIILNYIYIYYTIFNGWIVRCVPRPYSDEGLLIVRGRWDLTAWVGKRLGQGVTLELRIQVLGTLPQELNNQWTCTQLHLGPKEN